MHSLRHALRGLAKSPALAIVAIATLALGIGAAARLDPMTVLRRE